MHCGVRMGDNGDHYRKPLTGVPALRMMALEPVFKCVVVASSRHSMSCESPEDAAAGSHHYQAWPRFQLLKTGS